MKRRGKRGGGVNARKGQERWQVTIRGGSHTEGRVPSFVVPRMFHLEFRKEGALEAGMKEGIQKTTKEGRKEGRKDSWTGGRKEERKAI